MRNARALVTPLLFFSSHPPGLATAGTLSRPLQPQLIPCLSRANTGAFVGMKHRLCRGRPSSRLYSQGSSTSEWRKRVRSPEEMEELGRTLADAGLGPGHTMLLYGDLGTGKTCLARAIIRACAGDAELPVTSPSYLLDNTYEGYDYETGDPFDIHHMDLYRLAGTEKDLSLLGFPKVLQECLCLIEWPQKIGPFMPKVRLEVQLQAVDEDTRDVEVKAIGGDWAAALVERAKEFDEEAEADSTE